MEVLKKYLFVMALLIVIAIVWAGVLFFTKQQFVPVNPNATSYTKSLKPSFDKTTLDKIDERTKNSFPVLPSEFFELDD